MPYWQHYRLRIKAMIQTRMFMVRHSVMATETEDRLAWGDR